ncbi:MAG: Rieske (2Fe-2S) protein [Phycisphaeraceae bacterium]
MAKWIDVGSLDQFPPGARQCVQAEWQVENGARQLPVCLMNVAGTIVAIENICPHAGMPIGEGELSGKVLTCPFHGYAYNVETGQNVDYPEDVQLRRLPVKAQGQRIVIDVAED